MLNFWQIHSLLIRQTCKLVLRKYISFIFLKKIPTEIVLPLFHVSIHRNLETYALFSVQQESNRIILQYSVGTWSCKSQSLWYKNTAGEGKFNSSHTNLLSRCRNTPWLSTAQWNIVKICMFGNVPGNKVFFVFAWLHIQPAIA